MMIYQAQLLAESFGIIIGGVKEHRMEEGMRAYRELSRDELLAMKDELEREYEDVKGKGLKLDMSRGKPSVAQLDMGMDIFDVLNSQSDLTSKEGVDVRNYGVLDGLAEAKHMMAAIMGVKA